jgi:hypothetical protein
MQIAPSTEFAAVATLHAEPPLPPPLANAMPAGVVLNATLSCWTLRSRLLVCNPPTTDSAHPVGVEQCMAFPALLLLLNKLQVPDLRSG